MRIVKKNVKKRRSKPNGSKQLVLSVASTIQHSMQFEWRFLTLRTSNWFLLGIPSCFLRKIFRFFSFQHFYSVFFTRIVFKNERKKNVDRKCGWASINGYGLCALPVYETFLSTQEFLRNSSFLETAQKTLCGFHTYAGAGAVAVAMPWNWPLINK